MANEKNDPRVAIEALRKDIAERKVRHQRKPDIRTRQEIIQQQAILQALLLAHPEDV